MDTPWNLDATRTAVQVRHGDDQLDLVRGSLQSVVDRQAYARIHFQDANKIADAYIVEKLSETSIFDITFAEDQAGFAEYTTVLRKVAAHLIACIQSMHALHDILAHAIYYSLALNLKPSALFPKAINITSVQKKLHESTATQGLARLLIEFRDGGDAKHLAALANHSKHRSVIFPTFNEDLTGVRPERHQVLISSFESDGEKFPQVNARRFLAAEYDRCSPIIIATGNELNRLFRTGEA